MAIIYKDLATLINTAKWRVMVDDTKEAKVPFYYRKYPEFKPLYSAEGSGMAHSMVTIDYIITMCNTDVVFAIVKGEDIVSIYQYLTSYTELLGRYVKDLLPTDPNVRYYNKCKVAITTLDEMAKHVSKLETKHQAFKEDVQLVDMLKMIG